jgi:hypothetical protein
VESYLGTRGVTEYNAGVRSVLLVGVVGCYAPIAPSGAPCADDGTCPAGLACIATPDGERCLSTTPPGTVDAPDEPPIDGPPGACQPRTLLVGGQDPEDQGWELLRAGNGTSTVSLGNGVTTLTTSGTSRQLLVLRDQVPLDAFALEFTLQVITSGGHTPDNAAIALMASFHDPAGNAMDTSRMVAIDNDGAGIGGASIGFDTKVLRTYRIEVTDGIRFVVPGGGSLSFGSFTTNGTIAFGDQSTVSGHASTFAISSIVLDCL